VGAPGWEPQSGSPRVGAPGWEPEGGRPRVGDPEWEPQGGAPNVELNQILFNIYVPRYIIHVVGVWGF
jgi:hypothetical protein